MALAVEALPGGHLHLAVRSVVAGRRARLYAYRISEPSAHVLCDYASGGEAFLGPSWFNAAAARILVECGWTVWRVPDLHMKALVAGDTLLAGSTNFTERARTVNRELVLLVSPVSAVRGLEAVLAQAERAAQPPPDGWLRG